MSYHPDTLAVHAGQVPDPTTNARAVPIYATTSYVFNDTQHAADLFGLRVFGNIYTRIMNPTSDVFEKRIAELEGGVAALAVASGQAATTLSILNLAGAGDNLVSSQTLYGGTYNLFAYTLPKWGVTTKFVDIHNLDQVRAAIDAGHPAALRRDHRQPPAGRAQLRGAGRHRPLGRNPAGGGQHLRRRRHPEPPDRLRGRHHRPFGHQVDRRPRHGHRRRGGGRRQVRLGQPDAHARASPSSPGPIPPITAWCIPRRSDPRRSSSSSGYSCCAIWARRSRRSTPSCSSRAWRRCRSESSATRATRWRWPGGWRRIRGSSGSPTPGSRRHPEHKNAAKYLTGGFGGVLTFGVKGGHAVARALIDRVKLFSLLANVGDAKSLIIHPASTTHEQLSPEQQRATGVTPELVRLSVGIEDLRDLIADLDQALGSRESGVRSQESAGVELGV